MKRWRMSLKTMSKLTDMFGLCKRAGKIITGFDPVKESVNKDKAKIVIIAKDLSAKTQKEVLYILRNKNIPLYETDDTLDEIQFALGRRTGVVAIEDENFAKKAATLCRLVL